MSDEAADLIDRFAAALAEYSPEKLGGVFWDAEDIIANAMVTQAEGKMLSLREWQQSTVEFFTSKGVGSFPNDGFGERLMNLLVQNQFGRTECIAAGMSEDDWKSALYIVVFTLWDQDLHKLVTEFVNTGWAAHSENVVNNVKMAREISQERKDKKALIASMEQTDDRIDEIVDDILRNIEAW